MTSNPQTDTKQASLDEARALLGPVGVTKDDPRYWDVLEERIATALAAKDAELADKTQAWERQWLQERDLKLAAIDAQRRAEAQLAEVNKALELAPDARHFEILAEAMAEVKATSDGLSDQSIADIVTGCIAEIDALPARRAREAQGGE